MHHSSPSTLPNQKSLWIQKYNKTHSLWLDSFLILMSSCTNWHLISLAHSWTADLISHPGWSLGVLISEPQRFIFILANTAVACLNFQNLSTNLQIFPENRVYVRVCVYLHTCVLFCNTRRVGDFFYQAWSDRMWWGQHFSGSTLDF